MSDRKPLLTTSDLKPINKSHHYRKGIIITTTILITAIAGTLILFFDIFNVLSKKPSSILSQPNIIVIMMDDLGFTDVGYNGHKITGFNTPTMDKLAINGIKLNYHYAPICSPTRGSFLTGKYPWRIGINSPANVWSLDHMDKDVVTISEMLLNNGYNNLMLGKWHLGYSSLDNLPSSKGFHKALYHQWGTVDYYEHTVCFGISTEDSWGQLQPATNITIANELIKLFNNTLCGYDIHDENYNVIYDRVTYYDDLFVEKALQFIENEKTNPFFIYYSMLTPHEPLTNPPPLNISLIYNYDECEIYNYLPQRKQLCQMIKYSDYKINQIIDKLKELNIYNNTIIAMFSDNGAAVYPWSYGQNLPLRGAKQTMFEGNTRTPAFIGGGYITNYLKIRKCDYNNLFSVIDWLPSLLSISNSETNVYNNNIDNIDGINLFDDILSECSESNQSIHNVSRNIQQRDEILEIRLCTDNNGNQFFEQSYIRTNEWKLIINSTIWGCTGKPLLPLYYNGFVNVIINDSEVSTENFKPYPNKTAYFMLNEYENNTNGLYYSKCYENMSDFEQTDLNNTLFNAYDEILLYHIIDDKIEACNVADQFPNVVNTLVQKLNDEKIHYHDNASPWPTYPAYVLSQIDSYECNQDITYMTAWEHLDDFPSGVNYSNTSFTDWNFVWKKFIQHKKNC